jgi:hypothetical protein
VVARRRGRPQKPVEADPEAEVRLVEFFNGMGLTYVPPYEETDPRYP